MATLLMISGGADSAAALIKLLTESKEPIFAHHIILSDRESKTRYKAEEIACGKVIAYCKRQYRDFKYTKSVWDFQLPYYGWNLTLAAFVGARVIRSFPKANITKFALGVIDPPGTLGMWEERVEEFTSTLYAGLVTARLKERPEIAMPVGHMTKKEVVDFLPDEVVKMVSFCRSSVQVKKNDFKPCGKCSSCKLRKESGIFPLTSN